MLLLQCYSYFRTATTLDSKTVGRRLKRPKKPNFEPTERNSSFSGGLGSAKPMCRYFATDEVLDHDEQGLLAAISSPVALRMPLGGPTMSERATLGL